MHAALREAAERERTTCWTGGCGLERATAGCHRSLAPSQPDRGGACRGRRRPAGPGAAGRGCSCARRRGGAEPGDELIGLTDDGSLLVPALGLQLPAPQLTAQQARDIGTLLASNATPQTSPSPLPTATALWQVHTERRALRNEASGPDTTRPSAQALVLPTPTLRSAARAFRRCPPDLAPTAVADDHRCWRGAGVFGGGRPAQPDRGRPRATRPRPRRLVVTQLCPAAADPALTGSARVAVVARSGLRRRYEETPTSPPRPHGATADEAATALQPARGGRTDPVSARATSTGYRRRRAWLGIPDPATGQKHSVPPQRPLHADHVLADDIFPPAAAAYAERRPARSWPLFIWCPGRHSPSVRPGTRAGWPGPRPDRRHLRRRPPGGHGRPRRRRPGRRRHCLRRPPSRSARRRAARRMRCRPSTRATAPKPRPTSLESWPSTTVRTRWTCP